MRTDLAEAILNQFRVPGMEKETVKTCYGVPVELKDSHDFDFTIELEPK